MTYDYNSKSHLYCTVFPQYKELPLKKKELDSKFNVDPQKSTIRIENDAL